MTKWYKKRCIDIQENQVISYKEAIVWMGLKERMKVGLALRVVVLPIAKFNIPPAFEEIEK